MKKTALYCLGFFALIFMLGASSVGAFYLAYKDKVLPGVSMNELPLENRTVGMTIPLLEKYLSVYHGKDLPLEVNGSNLTVSQNDIGFEYNFYDTAWNAYYVGRKGSLSTRLKEAYTAYRYGYEIKPTYSVDSDMLDEFVTTTSDYYDQPAVDSKFILQGSQINIISSRPGVVVDRAKFRSDIITSLSSLSFDPVVVELENMSPKINNEDLIEYKIGVEELIRNPVQLAYGGNVWEPTASEMVSFIAIKRERIGSPTTLSIDRTSVGSFLEKLKPYIEKEANPGTFEMNNNRVVEFTFPEDGVAVDMDKSLALVERTIVGEKGSRIIDIPVIVSKAPGLANEYGIRDLIGEGTTHYRGSIAGRVHNIGLASKRVSGVLVPPGEVFSFSANVGEITAATGYDQAYIISDRKTVLGTGGGVCQVSTTMYHAALDAGMEIIERYPHSYRVSYYEPAGMDATVYAPSIDLKYKNNTANYILIDSEFKPEDWELTFRIYGTDDGRQVEIVGPTISAGGAPPEPIYQEDPSLAPGQVKQIDFAAWGARAYFERTVTRGEEILIDETVHSSYSPWQAVFLVGPEE